ncbi:choline-sulfatase [Litoreibacter sp.]|nr:choline-sulfatase [Litoreibacter sp.]
MLLTAICKIVDNHEEMMMTRPNILFIQVDQLTASALRAYGNTFCHAPNLDRLAKEGVVVQDAYCNFPLCSPSRASMVTGKLCSKIGAYDNAAELPASLPTYAHYLRAAGYQTSLSGKMHFIGPDQYHGFEKRLTPDLYPADFSWVPNWGDEGKRDTNDARSVTISGICERSVQIDFDDLVTYHAKQHLFDMARSSDTRPFFMQVSYTHPHEPYLCRKEFWDLYEDIDIPLPEVPALSAAQHDAHSVRLLTDFGMLDAPFTEEDIRRSRRAYYGSISYLDQMIGTILETLTSTGYADNTAIIFTSDHGEMLGERGMWFKKHFFEPSLRVPLIMKIPGSAPGIMQTPASLVDLLPTFMGLAEGSGWTSDIEDLDGSDLTAIPHDDPERPIYAEYLAEATTTPIFMIRRGRYKFVYSRNDPALLFDLKADPNEMTNLATDLTQESLVAEFSSLIEAKWDSEKLAQDIILSQQRRRLVINGFKHGSKPRWNHGETPQSKVDWYRGEGGYNEWAFKYLAPSKSTDSPSS